MHMSQPHPKPLPRVPAQPPALKHQHQDLQQQAEVARRRDRSRDDAEHERLRRAQADRQSDAI